MKDRVPSACVSTILTPSYRAIRRHGLDTARIMAMSLSGLFLLAARFVSADGCPLSEGMAHFPRGTIAVGRPTLRSSRSAARIWRDRDGLPQMKVVCDGIPVDMVVDTGATLTLLSEADARKVFPHDDARAAGTIRTAGGPQLPKRQRIAMIEVLGKRLRARDVGLVRGMPYSLLGLDSLAEVGPLHLAF